MPASRRRRRRAAPCGLRRDRRRQCRLPGRLHFAAHVPGPRQRRRRPYPAGCGRPGTLLLAGPPRDRPSRPAARQAGLPLLDYFQRPELECLNAVPTAEGCLALLLQLRRAHHLGERLPGSRLRTHRPGGSAAAGPAGRTYHRGRPQCRAAGQRPVCGAPRCSAGPPCPCCWQSIDAVINTIPAPVLPRALLEQLPRGALVIDLASLPGGTDFAAAEELGICTPSTPWPCRASCAPADSRGADCTDRAGDPGRTRSRSERSTAP